jgi:acetyl-CoA acetyltransferase
MDDKNSSNVWHPLQAALMIFHATVRNAFETAAAFWRPWFREPEKKDVAARQHSKAASEAAPQPTKREQEATMEKKPKAPTKRSLKDEQELEREDRAQKTERLRKLRLAKEAAAEKSPSNNGRDEHAIKE